MLNTKIILAPVDFSECSMNALKYAADLARQNKSDLLILYVKDPKDVDNFLHGNLSTGHLIELLDRDEILKNIKHEFILGNGSVHAEILRQQKKRKPGLIVMGTHGATSRNKKLFGTNTTAVISDAQCPVLAIPETSAYHEFKKVVLATDQNKKNIPMIQPSIDLIRPYQPELLLLYVDGKVDESVETLYLLSEIPGNIKKHVTYPNTSMYVSSHKKVSEGIEHFVRRKKADLLIMITRHRSLFQSVINKSKTKKMALQASVPLLAVPQV